MANKWQCECIKWQTNGSVNVIDRQQMANNKWQKCTDRALFVFINAIYSVTGKW